jgi:hypothetical protein
MAKVPTPESLGMEIGETRPFNPPTDGQNTELAFAGRKIDVAQKKAAIKGVLELTGTINDAMVASKNREDTINRAIEFNKYFEEMSNEFSNLSKGEMASSANLAAFNSKLTTRTQEFLDNHQGTEISRARLAERLENQRADFSASAQAAVEEAQQVLVDQEFGDGVSKIIAQVAQGKLTLDQALVQVDAVANEIADATSEKDLFDKTEAAQDLVILGTLQRFIDFGEIEKAEDMINRHPEVMKTLNPKQVGKMVRSIEVQKAANAKAIQEKRVFREDILAAAGVTDSSQLSPQLRMLYLTGKMGPKPTPEKDNRTTEQKNVDALALAKATYGDDSPNYLNLKALVFNNKTKSNMPEAQKVARLETLQSTPEGANSPEAKNLEALIKEDEVARKFMEDQKKVADFPDAQDKITKLRKQTEMLAGKIDEALILATNADDLNEALILAKKGEGGFWETGNIGMAWGFISGETEAAELEEALTPIRANTVLKVMGEMRAQSSAGATGLGAMNDAERIMLRDAEGSLSTRVPGQLLSTLLRMRKHLPEILKVQEARFKEGFKSVLGTEPETPDPNAVSIPKDPRGNGERPLSTSGKPFIDLSHFEGKDG